MTVAPGVLSSPVVAALPDVSSTLHPGKWELEVRRPLDPVHARHHHVRDDGVGIEVLSQGNGSIAIVNSHRVVAFAAKDHGEAVGDDPLVIDNSRQGSVREIIGILRDKKQGSRAHVIASIGNGRNNGRRNP